MTDDQTLRAFLTQAAEGDPEAFARIIERFHDDMARVAFVVSGDGDVESAQVAVRAAWATARRGLGTMGNPERLPAWLMGIAAKQAREATQARGRRREDPAVGESGVAATRASSAPAYRTDQREVANALAPLDAHDRMIVGLRYIAGLDADAIGVELGMPGSAVQARIARVLSELLKDLKGEPTDTIEHYERGLTQLVRSFADLAVVPIDVAAVAQAANEAAAIPEPGLAEQLRGALVLVWEQLAPVRERFRKFNPLDWLLVAGLLVIVVAVVFAGGGPGSGGRATQNPSDATRLCEATELEAHVVAWETTNAYRNATVEMRNVGKDPCLVDSQPEPWLTAWPRDAILIGQERQGTTRIGPGDVLHTIVSVRNYCGAAPKPPVSVAFRQGSTVIAATPLTGSDLSGVPPCGGYPGTKDDIQMRPWAP